MAPPCHCSTNCHVTQLENKCPQVSCSFSAICLLKELFECFWLCFSTLLLKSKEIPTNYRPFWQGFANNNLGFCSLCDAPHRHAPLHSHHWRHWWNTWFFAQNLTHLVAWVGDLPLWYDSDIPKITKNIRTSYHMSTMTKQGKKNERNGLKLWSITNEHQHDHAWPYH